MTLFGRTTRAILAVIVGWAVPATAQAADRSSDGAVVVLASTATEHGFGSGTIVAKSGIVVRVLTANHVATHGTLSLRFDDGAVFPAHILTQFPDRDLALIEASVDPARAANLHVAPVAAPRSHELVHIWGSGVNGPAFETGAIASVGAEMPDGPANGRYALGCATCHQGDSGGGIFDAQGDLVGVYLGYFIMGSGPNVSVAELPGNDVLNLAWSAPASMVAEADFSR
jgi:serine protease Do